jgi:hypothetical protein
MTTDFGTLIQTLVDGGVRFVVIGGVALVACGGTRITAIWTWCYARDVDWQFLLMAWMLVACGRGIGDDPAPGEHPAPNDSTGELSLVRVETTTRRVDVLARSSSARGLAAYGDALLTLSKHDPLRIPKRGGSMEPPLSAHREDSARSART